MPEHHREQKKGRVIFYFLIATGVLIFDQVTKTFVLRGVNVAESIPVIKGIFHITLVLNRGVAFGLFINNPVIPKIIGLFVGLAILIFLIRFSQRLRLLTKLSLSFILAGCVGNLIDRLRFGVVIDFLDFRIWPVFNVADSAITVGVVLLLFGIIVRHRIKADIG